MDKKLWDSLVLIVVLSNALGILVLFESIVFKFPYVTLFIFVLYGTWSFNKKMFAKKSDRKKIEVSNVDVVVEA